MTKQGPSLGVSILISVLILIILVLLAYVSYNLPEDITFKINLIILISLLLLIVTAVVHSIRELEGWLK